MKLSQAIYLNGMTTFAIGGILAAFEIDAGKVVMLLGVVLGFISYYVEAKHEKK